MNKLLEKFRNFITFDDDVTAGYKDYADFAYHASPLQKEKLIACAIEKANGMQRSVAEAATKSSASVR